MNDNQKQLVKKSKRLAVLVVLLLVIVFAAIDFLLGHILIPRNFNDFRTQNSWYHHGLQKNVSTLAAWGPIMYPFYTNNFGFRDSSVRDIPLLSDKKRILILGDSHSEGVGVDYQFTFAGRMQASLADRGIEILNASAVSYSPKIHFLKGDYYLNRIGLEVDEVWVIIDISDLQNEIAYEKFLPRMPGHVSGLYHALRDFLQRRSFVFHSFSSIKDNKEYELFKNTLLSYSDQISQTPTRNAIDLYRDFFSHFDDQALLSDPNFHGVSEWIYKDDLRELADLGLRLGMENIALLNGICKQKDIRVRLSVHPWQTQVMKGDTTDYYVERWRAFCAEEGIGFVNLYPLFITHENPLWIAKTCYIEGDNHWNEFGHERVASHMLSLLEE